MAFNGSGTYSLPAGNPVVTGTTISSSTTNTTNSDIATALTNCITRDGQSTPSANLPMNAKKLTGLAAGTVPGDSVRYEQIQYIDSVTSAGSAGQVLTSAGAGAPTWQTPASPAGVYLALAGGTMSGNITFNAGQTIAGYLPLAGGTMSGNITFNSTQFGTGVGTFLSTPSSANLAAALTDETGTGSAVFATSPTLVTPVLGTPTSGDLSNCTNAVGYGLKSATTTVSISGATAPSAGQILTATGSTTATWQNSASSSVWVYLSTVTASGATTADIETTFNSTYNAYVLVASNVSTSGGGGSTQILCRQKIGGVYKTSSYAYGVAGHSSGGSSPAGGSSATYIGVTPSSSIDITCADFVMYIYSPSSSTITNALHWQGMAFGSATYGFAGGGNNSTGVLTGVRFYTTLTGTISGTFRLYGIKNS